MDIPQAPFEGEQATLIYAVSYLSPHIEGGGYDLYRTFLPDLPSAAKAAEVLAKKGCRCIKITTFEIDGPLPWGPQ